MKVLLPISIALLLSACGNSVNHAPSADPQTVVTTKAIVEDLVIEERRSGIVKAHNQISVISRVEGQLLKKHVRAGDSVEQGELMYVLDVTDYELELSTLTARLHVAETRLAAARRDHRRARRLGKAISQQDIDEIQTAQELASGEIKVLEARLDQVALAIERSKITAPISGRVGTQAFDEGALISLGSKLTNIINDDQIEFGLQLDERTLANIAQDLRSNNVRYNAWLELLDGTLLPEMGKMTSTDNSVNPETGFMTINFVFSNNGTVFPGQFAKLLVKRVEKGIKLPQSAIVMTPDGDFVLQVVDGAVVKTPIESNYPIKNMRQITGLTGGESIIVSGQQKLAPGTPVVEG